MIRTLHRGWPGGLIESQAFEKYMQKIGAETVNGKAAGKQEVTRDYALLPYSIGIRYKTKNNLVTISAEGAEKDVDKFEKKLAHDCVRFGFEYD